MNRNKLCIFFSLAFFLMANLPHAFAGSPSYKKVLKQWSRSDRIYGFDDLHAKILWEATLLNEDMLKAQASKYAKIYNLSSKEEQKIFDERTKKRGNAVLFFVSFYAGKRPLNDLTDPKANWDLRLIAGGEVYKPIRVEKISKPTSLQNTFYPYLSNWAKGYYVWFSAEVEKKAVPWELSLRGPLTHSKLTWQ